MNADKRTLRLGPSHFHDPVGLFVRLLRTRDPAALFAVGASLASILAAPLDLSLCGVERRLYKMARAPQRPTVFVTGAARSGTSLVAQVLIEHLPVGYINNLTAVFPRSPIAANRLFGRFLRRPKKGYHTYYGKTEGLAAPNDGLHIWDRWLGKDRTKIPGRISSRNRAAMQRFFGALEHECRKPIVNKNNNLHAFAHLVAEILPGAVWICVTREAPFHAQSLLKARLEIHGNARVPYGLDHRLYPDGAAPGSSPIEDVCRQVRFHRAAIEEQEKKIGPERFWKISYESFCREPERLVARVAGHLFGPSFDANGLKRSLRPFQAANTVKLAPEMFARICRTFERLT